MATITELGAEIWNTTAGNKTVTATPAVNDLIVVVAGYSNTTQLAQTVTDDNSAGTYTEILHVFDANVDHGVGIYVRTALVGSAVSTIFTRAISGDTGGGLDVFKVTGMSRVGASAVLQSATQQNGAAASTPTVTFGAAVLTANALVEGLTNSTSPAGPTPPTGFTATANVGYSTPTSGLQAGFRSSGETRTTIPWQATSATAFNAGMIELDTSAAGAGSDPGFKRNATKQTVPLRDSDPWSVTKWR